MIRIFPAVDVRAGHAVRLYQGDYNQETVYDNRPLDAAIRFEKEGAEYLHAVDLDGARSGETDNFEYIREIIDQTRLQVEIGGGIRTEEAINKYLEAGAMRVILGTKALEDPGFVREMAKKYGERIVVGVDAKDGMVATRGWLDVSTVDAFEFLTIMRDAGVKSAVFTDISRDGAMQGTNIEAYRRLSKIENLSITASGGICTLDEILTLDKIGTGAAILGRALYTGDIKLRDVFSMLKEN